MRTRLVPHRALLDEVARAELDAGGLLIDLGAPDQHKYTRGAWRSGWGKSRDATGGATAIELSSRRAWLDLPTPAAAPAAIVVRARSTVADQRITFFAGERELGTAALAPAWSVIRVPIAAEALPRAGVFRLELRADKSASKGARAELDWLWLARAADPAEPLLAPRVAPVTIGGTPRRALISPDPRTYAFYVEPPAGAHLVVDLGAVEAAVFTVTAIADGAAPIELLRERVTGRWTERAVSLADFAGKAVRLELATADQTGAVAWGEPELAVAAPPAPPPAPTGAPPKNVVLVVMDTARADAFGPYAGPDRIARTPHLDALAAESTVFTAAYNNENWTKPSVATILSGLYPTTHDTKRDESELPRGVELLSERLRRDGFATAGFVANGYVSEKFGFEQGWDEFKNYIRESRPSEAEHVFGDALAWLARHRDRSPGKPFFLYVQAIDPHVAYAVDRAYWGPYFDGEYTGPLGPTIDATDQVKLSKKQLAASDRDLAWLRALYYGEVSYLDEHLGTFVAELAARGLRDETLLVITNDHGEELGDRGRFGHGHQVFEELVRAPLLISYPPAFPRGKVVADIVEHVDLAPTILDVLGTGPLAGADGHSFLPLVRGVTGSQPRYAISEFLDDRRLVRVGGWKLVTRGDGSAELFDLRADPREARPLGDTAAIAHRLCQVHLGEGLAVPDKATRTSGLVGRRRFQAGAADIDSSTRRQLEALGYLGGAAGDAPKDDAKDD